MTISSKVPKGGNVCVALCEASPTLLGEGAEAKWREAIGAGHGAATTYNQACVGACQKGFESICPRIMSELVPAMKGCDKTPCIQNLCKGYATNFFLEK